VALPRLAVCCRGKTRPFSAGFEFGAKRPAKGLAVAHFSGDCEILESVLPVVFTTVEVE
jgi:hypothetical protein